MALEQSEAIWRAWKARDRNDKAVQRRQAAQGFENAPRRRDDYEFRDKRDYYYVRQDRKNYYRVRRPREASWAPLYQAIEERRLRLYTLDPGIVRTRLIEPMALFVIHPNAATATMEARLIVEEVSNTGSHSV